MNTPSWESPPCPVMEKKVYLKTAEQKSDSLGRKLGKQRRFRLEGKDHHGCNQEENAKYQGKQKGTEFS